MSTFRGVVDEFPDIRVDFFQQKSFISPPLACFLSHVHSDHLAGLDAEFRSPFIYCSAATREILLRLEKYPHRMNFALGILEKSRITYGHLDKLLKTIPLETPTRIELEPGNAIQVTLFDANHCTGSVMFLIENSKNAILYTGDIRSDPWFVNNLTRNPFLIGYTSGLKTLDCIYLDTSNTVDIPFPPKADGLKELLQKVSKYPADTVFHFAAWTFGYEEVWMALSHTLKSQIHVDKYKFGLYESLHGNSKIPKDPSDNILSSGPFLAYEGPVLTGYKCGNVPQIGCLTRDPEARIHSCEKGIPCTGLNEKTVWIRPIVTRTEHGEMAEVGVGGGGDDLKQPLELILKDEYDIDQFLGLLGNTKDPVVMDIKRMLREGLRSHQVSLYGLDLDQGKLPLKKIAELLARSLTEKNSARLSESLTDKVQFEALPRVITFPYSRHSSYAELCHLIRVFNPKDVYPCTVDEENWDEDISMKNLFGIECLATNFRHDDEMRELHNERQTQYTSQQTNTTASSDRSSQILPLSSPIQRPQKVSSPIQQMAQATKQRSVVLRRNSHGQLRQFDADGNEVVPLNIEEKVQRAIAEEISMVEPTPPREVITISPGFASQSLRRKAIFDGVPEGFAKRVRRDYDGASSPPPPKLSPGSKTPSRREHNLPDVFEISNESNTPVPAPGSEADTPVPSDQASAPAIETPQEEDAQALEDPYVRGFDNFDHETFDDNCFIDQEDNIVRCKFCGHEVWTVWMTLRGFCTSGCNESRSEGPREDPYYEIIDPEAGPRPGFALGDFAEFHLDVLKDEHQNRKNIVGDYLDDHSDAYDSIDEDHDNRSDYDAEDSFIDDADSEHGNEDSSSDEEITDYKQMFNDLQRKHDRLVYVHESMMQDLLDSEYEYYEHDAEDDLPSDIEEIDEYGAIVVDVVTPDPVVAELVLSQAQEQSQESEVSADRINDRAKAFQAVERSDWNTISMVSTGDNHTHEEIEL